MIFIITSQYQPYEFQEKLLSEDLLIEYFYQIISGVCALHDKGFIFPFDAILLENIFKLDAENVAMDVFSSLEEEILEPKIYHPPEVDYTQHKGNTKEGNMFNLGLLFFMMSCQQV
jgi:hypothetical protein